MNKNRIWSILGVSLVVLLMACSNGDEQESLVTEPEDPQIENPNNPTVNGNDQDSLVTKPEDPQIENPSNNPTNVVMKEREDISLTAEGSKINDAVNQFFFLVVIR